MFDALQKKEFFDTYFDFLVITESKFKFLS